MLATPSLRGRISIDMQYVFADPMLVTMFRFLVKTSFFLVT